MQVESQSLLNFLDRVYDTVPTLETLSLEISDLDILQTNRELLTIHIYLNSSSIIALRVFNSEPEHPRFHIYMTRLLQALEELANSSPVAPDPIIGVSWLLVHVWPY